MPSSSSPPVVARASSDAGGGGVAPGTTDAVVRASVVAVAIGLVGPLLPWWVARAASPEAWTGLLLSLVGVLVAATSTSTRASARALAPLALAGLVAVGVGVAVAVRTLQAAGVVAVVFALVGAARRGPGVSWPALGLVWLGLPLSGDVDVVGFPLRQASAALAALVLRDAGVVTAVTETVLVAEHGVADVEAPCAGLATIRLLVAVVLVVAALRRTRIRRVGAAVGAVVVVAVVGNAARVAVLAALVLGAGRTDLAALLHVPLGVVVFVVAAAAAAPLLVPGAAVAAASPMPARPFAVPGVAAVAALALLVGARAPGHGPARDDGDARLAAALEQVVDGGDLGGDERLPLSPAEDELFARHAIAAGKKRVGARAGEELVVVARSLRALHAPERCLAGSGHAIAAVDVVVRGSVAVKRLVLDGGDNLALSLLRSPRTHAATLGDVAVARLHGDGGPWVFVSAVVANDGSVDEDALARALVDDATAVLAPPPNTASSFLPAAAGDS